MKAKRITMLWSLPIMAATLALSSAQAQQLSTTEWNADPATPGNWADLTWSAGVQPAADSLAGIVNGGTVGVTAPTAILEQLLVSGSSTLNVGALLGIEGSNAITTPATPATGLYVYSGTVNVNAGGDLRVNTGGFLRLGIDATAALNLLANGSLTTDREFQLGRGGTSGFGTLTQSGGTLTHTGPSFQVGPNNALGRFDISDGTAIINNLRVDSGGSIAGQINIVNHTGGDITCNGETSIGHDTVGSATYNLSGGSLTTVNRIRIGVANKGDATRINTFNQTGGNVDVTGTTGRIDIGDGSPPEVVNIYDMSDGTLTTSSQILVGYSGSSSGTLKLRGFANINLPGMFIGFAATNTGTVTVEDEASGFITNLEVRNGTYTQSQSGEVSNITVAGRLWVGTTQTVSKTATMTLTDGILNLTSDNRIGNENPGNATLNIEGGTLTTTGILRVGIGKIDGTLTPTNLVNQTGGSVTINNRLDIGQNPGPTNTYQISGGSLTTTNQVMVGYSTDGTGTFTVSGTADVNVPSVVMGENAGTNTTGTKGTVILNGGTLTTTLIKVGNGATADQTLVLNGGAIKAKADAANFISGNVTTTSLLSGGVTFEVPDMAWTCTTTAVMTGPGGLTKTGTGALTVNSVQEYTGATKVREGTLQLTQPYLADNGDVYLYTGAVLDLTYAPIDPLADPLVYPTDTIGTLYINDVPQLIGTYGGTGTGAGTVLDLLMKGTGVLNATSSGAPAEPPVITSITVSGGTATITITGAPSTTYVCKFSKDLITPFATIATVPATITTDVSGAASFTVDASVAKRFYIVGKE